jgi:enoyl-CoA hydratase/carnithine racemase
VKPSVSVEGEGPVRTIWLARPPINALDGEALWELATAADLVAADVECRVVVVASAIEGIFSGGGDLKFWRAYPRERAQEVSLAGREVSLESPGCRNPPSPPSTAT